MVVGSKGSSGVGMRRELPPRFGPLRPIYSRSRTPFCIQGQTVKIPPHSILLRGSRRPLPCRQTTRIFSSEICRLDELEHTLVLGASTVLCWKHRCINGRVDISVSLSLHGAVQRSGRECVHSLPTAWTRCIFPGIADAATSLPVPLCRAGRFSIQCRPGSLYRCGSVDWAIVRASRALRTIYTRCIVS